MTKKQIEELRKIHEQEFQEDKSDMQRAIDELKNYMDQMVEAGFSREQAFEMLKLTMLMNIGR